MASYDGSITIKLGLNQKDYDAGLDKATKSTESFVDKVKSTFIGATAFKVAEKGWNLISGSIEKATNRLDSMAKAKQVMGILAGSTEKATQVVNLLNDAVTDTAYGLDSAATSTQKLATSGLGMDQSAKMVMDLMDAITFYGDGTNATLENVVDAMSKMNASGKISADQWQRLTDAGIPVVKIFAEQTGKSMAEVMDAFSTGAISAQDFNDILMDALENGTASFPAVAGKAKEMAGSFATSFSNMSARIAIGVGNVVTAFNDFLQDSGLPSLQEMIAGFGSVIKNGLNWVAENLPGVLNGLKDGMKVIADNMPQTTAFIEGLSDAFKDAIGPAKDLISGVFQWFVDNLPSIAKNVDDLLPLIIAIATAAGVVKGWFAFLNAIGKVSRAIQVLQGAWAALMAVNPIVLAIAAITALVAAFAYLWKTNETFRQFWIDLWDKIKQVASDFVEWLKQAWGTTVQTIHQLWDGMVEFFKGIADGIQQAWDSVVKFFTETIPEAFQKFLDKCAELRDTVVDFFTVTIPQAITDFVNSVKTFFGETVPYYIGYCIGYIIASLLEFADNLKTFATETIPEFVDKVIEWFSQLPGKIWDWLVQTFEKITEWGSQTIESARETGEEFIRKISDWFSQIPGKVSKWLSDTHQKAIDWGTNMVRSAEQAGSEFVNRVVTWISSVPGKVSSWFNETMSKVSQFVGDMARSAAKAGSEFFNGVVNAVNQIPGKMLSIGGAIVQGIKDGISNAWGGITSWFSSLADGFVDGFKSKLGIHSPSRVFRNLSKWIPKGVVEGIKDTMPEAVRYMSTAGDQLTDAFNADGLSTRMRLEGQNRTGESWRAGNTYTVNQTINSAKALTPSEVADETRNAVRRFSWQ